ncbi:type II toxin-antitoxin system RelE/ParE family toxin [uncultured Desulfovibrio sp.]|uniref:type II toxin-antitoxin system RelE/ParE family toxin n=1 Tax=uncultured Desulfovibrio sp. TaxID=167968 RepID=UPI002804206F|nr:type II toxin-antitoxin system RelE/ParE family toxin [uncultured Desulfovibrio sp.]
MKVVWTLAALTERNRLVSFIAQDNVAAALDIDDRLTHMAESLATFPFRGRNGRDGFSKELVVHKNYLLVYGIDEATDTIYIKAVLHAARQYPPDSPGQTVSERLIPRSGSK